MGDEKDTSKDTNKSVIGEHSDKAIADIVRGLLLKPAETAGELISDTIGILGDRVRSKRQLNAQLGLEEVRKQLESSNADIKDITPPDEEELHLLVNGLSLAGDDALRGLWAGLFAKALEPNSGVTAERPFIQILESLSRTDAVALDFLACAYDANEKIQLEVSNFVRSATVQGDEKETHLYSILKAKQDSADRFIRTLETKIRNHGLDSLNDEHWDENLMRLGLIERISDHQALSNDIYFRSGSAHEVRRAFEHVINTIEGLKTSMEKSSHEKVKLYERPSGLGPFCLHVKLTPFGERFAKACGIVS